MGLAMTFVPVGAVITAQPVQPDSQNHREHRSGYHGSGSAAKAGGAEAKELPKTGGTVGAPLLAVGAGTLLVGGGLLARRIGSSHRSS